MRLITDDNVDQLLNMSYSNNITKLLKLEEPKETQETKIITREYYNEVFKKWTRFQEQKGPALDPADFKLITLNKYETVPNLALLNKNTEKQPIEKIIDKYIQDVKFKLLKQNDMKNIPNESPILPSAEHSPELPPAPPNSYDSPGYAPLSPADNQGLPPVPPNSPNYVIDNSPGNTPGNAPGYTPGLDEEGQPLKIQIPQNVILTPSSDSSQPPTSVPVDKETILEVDEPKPEEKNEGENSEGNSGSSNDSKKIILSADVNENA